MAPKKKVAANGEGAENNEGGDSTFRWTPENDRALLILTFGRTLCPEDYHKLVDALPPGTNYNGVRIRVSKLRVEQRKRFEELGWKMPDSDKASATSRKKEPATPRKKRDTVEAVGEEDEVEKPKKKPRVKKGKKAEQEQEQEVLDKVEVEGEVSVKEENIKEEMNA